MHVIDITAQARILSAILGQTVTLTLEKGEACPLQGLVFTRFCGQTRLWRAGGLWEVAGLPHG